MGAEGLGAAQRVSYARRGDEINIQQTPENKVRQRFGDHGKILSPDVQGHTIFLPDPGQVPQGSKTNGPASSLENAGAGAHDWQAHNGNFGPPLHSTPRVEERGAHTARQRVAAQWCRKERTLRATEPAMSPTGAL